MQTQYFIIADERQAGPFSKDELKSRHITPDTLVWRAGLPDWVKAGDLSDLSDILVVETHYEDLDHPEESRWFAMLDGQQVGPYTVETLISMGLKPNTPVWRAGMADWADASTQPEIMRHFGQTPPPRNNFAGNPQYGQQPNYGQNPQYGQNNQNQFNRFSQNPYGQNNGYNNFNNQPAGRTNWLPWAIVATIAGFLFSCIGAIFGIIGIVNANKANELYQRGDDIMADQANNTAKTMTIIGLVLAGVGLIASSILFNSASSLLNVI